MEAERCIVNFVLGSVIITCLILLWGRWRGELDRFYQNAWEEELKDRNDGSYERYLKAKQEAEKKEKRDNS